MGQLPHGVGVHHRYVDPMTLRTRFFALTYDRQMAKVDRAGLHAVRQDVLRHAHGDVLEIGAGTGTNLARYGAGVTSLTMTEPDASMLRRLERKAATSPGTKVFRAPAEDLPFDDDSFDVVVSALVLCGVSDQPRALREIHRVLRPGGSLLFIEHVLSDVPGLARRQHRMNGFNRFLVGCECDRPTVASLRSAGFTIEGLQQFTAAKVPSWIRPMVSGVAHPVRGKRYAEGATTTQRSSRSEGIEGHGEGIKDFGPADEFGAVQAPFAAPQ